MRLQTVLDGSTVLAQEHLPALCQRLEGVGNGLFKVAHLTPHPAVELDGSIHLALAPLNHHAQRPHPNLERPIRSRI